MKAVAEFFFLALGFGTYFFAFLANPKATGAGFIKVINAVSFFSLLFGLIFHLTYAAPTNPQAISYMVALFCLLLTYLFYKESRSWLLWLLYIIQLIALLAVFYFSQNASFPQFSFAISSGLLLGLVTYAMLQGHWYLVVPKMSESPLVKAMLILWPLLLIKGVWTGLTVIENMKYFEAGTRLGSGYSFNWLMLTMRVVWGYLIIAIMSYFSWRLIRMRSLQSATGILYAMTFFVIVGELISAFLYTSFGLTL